MADLQRQVIEKPLHPRAQEMAAGHVEEFADALVLQSKTLATLDGVDEVQGIHVAAARELILKAGQTKSRSSELLALFGAALFGAFIQGFLQELSNNRPTWMAVYAAAGFLGMLLVFWGFRK